MKVYLTGAFEHYETHIGYGNAGNAVFNKLKEMGVDVHRKPLDDDTPYDCDIEISYNYPGWYKFYCDRSYKIGYSAWESTEFLPPSSELAKGNHWHDGGPDYVGVRGCDELWATNNFVKKVYENHGVDKEITVYNHGISPLWVPKKRSYSKEKPFTFLHIGDPASRKDAQMVVDVFTELYGDDERYKLILKCTNLTTTNRFNPITQDTYRNIEVWTQVFSEQQMIHLYNNAHAFVYPSWGEGFGFNSFQAIAMGLPTICTSAWADYKKYITLPIRSQLSNNPWTDVHPGLMYKPDKEELKFAMKYIVSNYDELSERAWKNSVNIHQEYDWDVLTKPIVQKLEKIYKTRL